MSKLPTCASCKGRIYDTAYRNVNGKKYCARSCWAAGEGIELQKIEINRRWRAGAQFRPSRGQSLG